MNKELLKLLSKFESENMTFLVNELKRNFNIPVERITKQSCTIQGWDIIYEYWDNGRLEKYSYNFFEDYIKMVNS